MNLLAILHNKSLTSLIALLALWHAYNIANCYVEWLCRAKNLNKTNTRGKGMRNVFRLLDTWWLSLCKSTIKCIVAEEKGYLLNISVSLSPSTGFDFVNGEVADFWRPILWVNSRENIFEVTIYQIQDFLRNHARLRKSQIWEKTQRKVWFWEK